MRLTATAFLVLLAACAGPGDLVPRTLHLGVVGQTEWDEFSKFPDASRLDLKFAARPNEKEQALFIRQDNVKRVWPVELNGRRLGTLISQEMPTVCTLAVPPGSLVDGVNTLSVVPPRE
ncbi:MAG: hypothetical protein ACREKH_17490, partial [Candidatus Rokuibacteriota bacterium]